jgi:pyruvate dehydrogenase E1 component beta subunit
MLGTAKIVRDGTDVTVLALAAMVPRALKAAEQVQNEDGLSVQVIDVRSLVPLDTRTIFTAVERTGRLVTVEENPRLCGWGAEISSLVAEERFDALKGPIVRITTPHVPIPSADNLEDAVLPTVARIAETLRKRIT